jgi:hypothetical protein
MLQTNRDLYLFVTGLVPQGTTARPLDAYLRALWRLASHHHASAAIELNVLAQILRQALTAEVPNFDPGWAAREYGQGDGYARWESTICHQIVDLRDMAAAGLAPDYFGVDAPRGQRWYNFSPETFLECGIRGCFGGCQEGDPSGVTLVPGKIAVMDESGNITAVDPREIDNPIYEIKKISWNRLADFLDCGQCYE